MIYTENMSAFGTYLSGVLEKKYIPGFWIDTKELKKSNSNEVEKEMKLLSTVTKYLEVGIRFPAASIVSLNDVLFKILGPLCYSKLSKIDGFHLG